MPNRFADDLKALTPADLATLSHEDLLAAACELLSLARAQNARLSEDSRTSSRPPSSDNPYRREDRRQKGEPGGSADETASASPDSHTGEAKRPAERAGARRPGKPLGAKGFWRSQPILVSGEREHAPLTCEACGQNLDAQASRRKVGAHVSLELTQGDMSLEIEAIKHVYFAARCRCGHESVERPGVGARSRVEGRKRDLIATERCLVGPMLCAFIASLSLRFRLSRLKIQEFLDEWLGLELGTATINRCVHEFGLASEPVVDRLIE